MINLTPDDFFSKEEEEQMRELNRLQKRLKEIEKEKKTYKSLIDEGNEVYARIQEIKSNIKMQTRQAFVGRCFEAYDKTKPLQAFKVIKIEDSSENRALCICLKRGDKYKDNVLAISRESVGLWQPAVLRLMSSTNEKLMIEEYREISEEKFMEMYKRLEEDILAND